MVVKNFAKLFVVEGIGQILAVLGENDDGEAVITLRISDYADCALKMDITLSDAEYDRQEAFTQKLLDEMTEEAAAKAVKPLIDVRNLMLGSA